MPLEIIDKAFQVDLCGFSSKVIDKNYAGTGKPLMDRLWKELKSKEIKNRGINYWVYEKNDMLFCGVEPAESLPGDTALELKKIRLSRYAWFKHTGPYTRLKEAYATMHTELEKEKINFYYPFLEIYGHWTADETKLETQIIFALDQSA